ncbi:type II secretion system protein [bacterium]|nr:type II secretion system protein [bacterium]
MLEFKKQLAFTLVEVLIALGVIGVISAMTLPTVIKNYQKKVTVERLKSTYSMLYQAVRMSEVDNGTLDIWEIPEGSSDYETGKIFAEKYFTPYLKNVKECKYKDCFSETFYDLDGTVHSGGSQYYSLVLANGIPVAFRKRSAGIVQIIVDINGKKAPNTRGKDIFSLLVTNQAISSGYFGYQNKPGLFFYGQGNSINHLKKQKYACSKTFGEEYRGMFCGALIIQNNWEIPDDYPW